MPAETESPVSLCDEGSCGGIRIAAVIPAINEVATVGEIVRRCKPKVQQVVVVDGGSDDGTPQAALQAGAEVLRQGSRGLGTAKREVILSTTADVLVFLDADGSHNPDDIPRLLEPILLKQADLVIGCRATGGSDELDHCWDHWPRRVGTRMLQRIINGRLNVHFTDVQNGFRAIRTEVARSLNLREEGYCIDQEMAVRCIQAGYRVVNVPSHEYRRRHGRSRVHLWKHGPLFLWSLGRVLLSPDQAIKRHT